MSTRIYKMLKRQNKNESTTVMGLFGRVASHNKLTTHETRIPSSHLTDSGQCLWTNK